MLNCDCAWWTIAEYALIAADKTAGGRHKYIERLLARRATDENNQVLFYYDARNEFDITLGTIPYRNAEILKKPGNACMNTTVLQNYALKLDEFRQKREKASDEAKLRAEVVTKRNERSFFENHGYSSILAASWEENKKKRRISSLMGNDETRAQLCEQVQHFLNKCSTGNNDECGVMQWKDAYIDDNVSYYLLNALDAARRKTGDFKSALINAVDTFSSQQLLSAIYRTFKDSEYRFVYIGETQSEFINRFHPRRGIGKQVFNSTFADQFLEEIKSFMPPSPPPTLDDSRSFCDTASSKQILSSSP